MLQLESSVVQHVTVEVISENLVIFIYDLALPQEFVRALGSSGDYSLTLVSHVWSKG